MRMFCPKIALCLLLCSLGCADRARAADKVTILYDAFRDSKAVTKDWGFSALVEHDGKRILFDTGNNADISREQT